MNINHNDIGILIFRGDWGNIGCVELIYYICKREPNQLGE